MNDIIVWKRLNKFTSCVKLFSRSSSWRAKKQDKLCINSQGRSKSYPFTHVAQQTLLKGYWASSVTSIRFAKVENTHKKPINSTSFRVCYKIQQARENAYSNKKKTSNSYTTLNGYNFAGKLPSADFTKHFPYKHRRAATNFCMAVLCTPRALLQHTSLSHSYIQHHRQACWNAFFIVFCTMRSGAAYIITF